MGYIIKDSTQIAFDPGRIYHSYVNVAAKIYNNNEDKLVGSSLVTVKKDGN